VAGGNSAASVPGVVELAPVFGNGGAGLAAEAARRTRRRGSTSPGLFPLHPGQAFSLHVWQVRVRRADGATVWAEALSEFALVVVTVKRERAAGPLA